MNRRNFLRSIAGAAALAVVSTTAVAHAVFDVTSYGAVAHPLSDNTTPIQNAVNAAGVIGGEVYFPHGVYNISGPINLNLESVVMTGEARWASRINQTTNNAPIFLITANFCGVKSLTFEYAGTPAPGATAISNTAANVTLADFIIRNSHTGIFWSGSNATGGAIFNFKNLNYESVGLFVTGCIDLTVYEFYMNAGNKTRGTLGGIRLWDRVEAFICSNGQVLEGVYPFTSACASYTLGNRPAYNTFSSVYFDSSANAALLADMVETDFIGCWFSNGHDGAGNPGCALTQTDSIRFNNCRFYNCGGHGFVNNPSALRTSLVNCKAESNSVIAGNNVCDGFHFVAGSTDFQVMGCQAHNGLHPGVQRYGVKVNSGCNNFIVANNNLRGNGTGGLSDSSSAGANKKISNNL